MSDCTYKLTLPDGQERTIVGKAAMKAFLVEEGMSLFYPDGKHPWLQGVNQKDVGAASQQSAPNKPIEDAGEKIGGARKDRWKERGLNLEDLDAMTEAEGAELATKANVWTPDYEALANAAEPVTASMVKGIYDKLAAKPKKNTPEGRRQYVQMMRIVRDVLTQAKGPEEVKNAYLEIRKRAGLNTTDPLARSMARELLFSVYKGRSDPFVFNGGDLMNAKIRVENGFPAKAEPWKSRLTVGHREGGNGTTERGIALYLELSAEAGTPLTREQIEAGFFRVRDKKNKTVAFAPTKEDAEAAAKTVYERDLKGKKEGKPEPVRPNLDELKRENLPQRIDRDVTSEDFVRDLGFRGVEFGNWSAQDERQRILNMAYDGLMDLAEIMGVPPKAMSLNGTLGMAFGARGGGRFAAHYEPGKLVINMTKIRGGGSMAHEWAHAMDHYFGELDKPDAYTTQARGASGWLSEDQYQGVPRKRMEKVGGEWKNVEKMRLDNLRPELARAFDEVMRALFQQQLTKAEMVRSQELDVERTEALAQKEQDADMKAMYQRMAENKRQALEELRKDPEDKMYAGRGRSDFANQAQALSGKSTNGYWTRPTEMFARAFESWVFDRVTAMGARSDYLVHGVEEDRFAGGGYKGNPYPTGEERARINAAFDKLADTIQTKETDKGVMMFRSGGLAGLVSKPLTLDAVQDAVDSILKRIPNAPQVEVYRTPADAGIVVASPMPKGGVLPDGRIVVFSDANTGRLDVMRTIFHELFHRGLKSYFPSNADYTQFMLDLAAQHSTIRDGAADWKKSQDGQEKRAEFAAVGPLTGDRLANYEALAVEEALATLSERLRAGSPLQARTWTRAVGNVLEKIARHFGMDGLADWIHGLNNSELDDFVNEIIARSGNVPVPGSFAIMNRYRSADDAVAGNEADQQVRRSFAGQQAATADTMALATAQQRLDAGEDAETVRQETGWHKGADGKWRFEINDADARLKDRAQWTAKIDGINAKLDAALQAQWQAEEQRNDFLRARGESPSRISSETKKAPEFKALAKALKNAEAAAEKARHAAFLARQGDSLITVGDVLSHPALFAAYPGIADVRVDINDSLPAGNAAYAYELRAIELSGKSDAQQILSTLLHEIQHGIQHIEGFAMGGTPQGVAPILEKERFEAMVNRDDALTAEFDALKLQYAGVPESEIPQEVANRVRQLRSEINAIRNTGWREASTPFARRQPTPEELFAGYRRLAGEVEARNTQARQNLTDAQRRATPPSQTADVADSDVIVMFNGKVAISAPTPANAAPDAAPQLQQPPRNPAATIRAAINRAYGKLLGQLESKGLVTLAQTEAQAIEAAAQARAKKTGGDVAQIKRSLMAAVRRSISVWHGTPHRGIEKTGFTLNKIGTGEGAQAYGWGMYFAGDRSVAENYRLQLSQGKYWYDGAILPNESRDAMAARILDGTDGDKALAISQIGWYPDAAEFENEVGQIILGMDYEKLSRTGQLYSLDLPAKESDLLDWDKPLSKQPDSIRPMLERLHAEAQKRNNNRLAPDPSGYQIYELLVSQKGGQKEASEHLLSIGIPGLRYLDGNSRSAGEGSHNYVIWDEALMTPDAANIDPKFSSNGAVQGFFDPQTGQSFLVADNLTAESAPGTLMHEVGIHMAADGTMQPLFERAARILKAQKGNAFMQRVQARLDAAGETSPEEVAAYLVEAYENDRANAPASVTKWLADLLATVKAWLHKKGIVGADSLSVADIAAVARANAKSIAARGASTGAQLEGIEYSVAQQLQSDNFYEAYRRALESGRTLGEDEITEGLAGKSKGGQRRGVLSFAGAKNPSTSTVFWESEVLGGGYYTTAMMRGKVGKREFIMFAIPERAAPEGTPEQLTNAVLSNKVILHTAARELSDGSWEFAVDGAHPTSPYYDELIARGELEPVANGYHRLKIPGASNSDFLRETARRLSMALDGKTPDIRYERATGWNTKRGDVVVPASKVEVKFSRATAQPTPASANWVAPSLEDAKHRLAWDNIVYTAQDKMVDIKRVQQAIAESGAQLQEQQDVYLQEELYHARVSKKSQEFVQKELDPMVKLLADNGVELADFEQYLHARHAPEANRVMMERNPTEQELQARMDAIYAQIEPLQAFKAKVGAKEQARLQRLIDQGIRKIELLATVQPWRGTEEDRQKLSGMSNQEAAAVMASLSPETRQAMEEAARRFDAIVKKNRQEMVDYDLENQDTVDGWADMFRFYVPLMREDEGNAQGTGQGFSIKGREVKSRTGSTKKVVDIVANLAMQRERTIVRGEKNRVSQALVGLASANPNPDFWRVGGPDVERKFDLRTGTVKTVTNPDYKNLPNVVTAKVRGADGAVKEVAVVFNEKDNRAARMASTLKNLDGQTLEGMYATMAPITRYLAAMSTQYNPIFGVVNLARDLQGAMVNLAGTPLADQKGKIAALGVKAVADIYRAARADRQNQPHTGEWSKWWDMFQEDGGPTGYRDIFQDSADRTKAITKTMNPDAWMESAFGKVVTANGLLKDPMRVMENSRGWMANWLSDYNLAMENGIRVSTYRAAIEKGMSRERAASLAKNITVNFNRKGQMALKAGALYAFFNAAMQGNARIGETLLTMDPGKPKTMRLSPLGKKVVYGGILLGALQAAVLAAMGFDDENPPDFVRERNLVIPVGGGKFITIPMPLGLHVFPGIGRHLTEFALSGGKEPRKRAIEIMAMIFSSFYPLGSAGISAQTLTPTAVDPFIALIENKDYAGRPIARESMDKNVPGHKLTRTTATWISQGIAEIINWITGGDKYVAGVVSLTPDQIDYLIGQATGGVGREALKAVQTAQAIYTGEELPMHKIPLVGRFFGTANGSASQSGPFYAKIDEAKRIDRRIDGLREDGQRQEAQTLERSHQFLLAKARIADRQVTRLRREKRKLLESGAPREQVRDVERQMADAMRRFNEATAK